MRATSAGTGRLVFIDVFRSGVILLMLEGHVLRTLVSMQVQSTPLYRLHEFAHGLSAPAFLFGAGLTFVISTKRRWAEFHHWGPLLSRRVRRLFFVFALGLFLHLPFFSFRKTFVDGMHSDLLQLLECDVLHCIGIGLLLLHALIFFFRTETRFYGLVLATVVAVCFLTPIAWDINFGWHSPLWLQWINGNHGSPFPLFPYLGFLFAGVIVSWEYLVAHEAGRSAGFMLRLYLVGAIAIGLGTLFDLLPFDVYPTYNYWFTSPNYFLIRVGALMILLSLTWYATRRFDSLPKVATILGVESLFVYVLHLVVLYGSVLNPEWNLQTLVGSTLSLGESVASLIVVTLVMLGAAYWWNLFKVRTPVAYRIVQLAASAAFLLVFFWRDY